MGGWFVQFGGKDLEQWGKVALDEALGAEAWLLGRRSYEFFGVRWRPRQWRACGQVETASPSTWCPRPSKVPNGTTRRC